MKCHHCQQIAEMKSQTHAIEQWGFFSLLLLLIKGHHWGPVTLTLVAKHLPVELSLLVLATWVCRGQDSNPNLLYGSPPTSGSDDQRSRSNGCHMTKGWGQMADMLSNIKLTLYPKASIHVYNLSKLFSPKGTYVPVCFWNISNLRYYVIKCP